MEAIFFAVFVSCLFATASVAIYRGAAYLGAALWYRHQVARVQAEAEPPRPLSAPRLLVGRVQRSLVPVVQAHTSKWIVSLGAALRLSMGACCDCHHFAAQALQIQHMAELGSHHLCLRSQQHVLISIQATLEKLDEADSMVFKTPELARMRIGLEVMRDVCADCHLRRFAVADAPRLCDPAKFIGYTPEES